MWALKSKHPGTGPSRYQDEGRLFVWMICLGALLFLTSDLACRRAPEAQQEKIVVFAAASLTDVMAALADSFEVAYPLQASTASAGSRSSSSSGVKTCESMRKRTPSGISSEKLDPRPGRTSTVSWVCFQ